MSHNLPNEYIELKYIQSTGTQWIESNINASATDIITIKGRFVDYWKSDNHAELIGCHNSGTYLRVGIIEQNSVKKFFASTGYWNENITGGIYGRGYPVCNADLKEHLFTYNFADNSLTIDTTRYALGTSTGTRSATGTSMIIFGYRQDGYYGVGAKAYFKMESCTIQQSGSIVRDFVPALRKSDVKPGLYDLVSNTFFVNQNQTGNDFAYELEDYKTYINNSGSSIITSHKSKLFSGPTASIVDGTEGATGYLDLEWIGSTGTQYIVTNIIPTLQYDIAVKAQKEVSTGLFGMGDNTYTLTGKSSYGNYFYVGRDNSASGDRQYVAVSDLTAVHVWGIKDGVGYCDSTSAVGPTGTTQPSWQLSLFGRYANGAISDQGKHRIYYAKIWNESGTLVGNFLPKLQLSTGKPGLYDTVTGTFYTNGGTGEFTYELNDDKLLLYRGGD